jgi:hypothetical protein
VLLFRRSVLRSPTRIFFVPGTYVPQGYQELQRARVGFYMLSIRGYRKSQVPGTCILGLCELYRVACRGAGSGVQEGTTVITYN